MSIEPPDGADRWRIRERSLFIGVLLFAPGVGILLAFFPAYADSILELRAGLVAAGILLSIGLLSAVAHMALLLLHSRKRTKQNQDLTEWDG